MVDENNNSVSGATVTVTNEVDNDNYPAQNVFIVTTDDYPGEQNENWGPYNTTSTGEDGHTSLPSNPSTSFVVTDFKRSWDIGTTEYTYTITAEKYGYTANVTGVNPNESWYREDPNAYQNTITIVLPMSQTLGNISGTVTNTTGSPIEKATVAANSQSNTTNSTGQYTITLPVGNYTVTASKTGYGSQSRYNISVLENQTTEVNFTLTVATTTTSTTSTSTTSTSTTSTTTTTPATTTVPTTSTIKKSSGGGGGGFSAIAVTKATCFDGLKNCHDESCEEGIDCGGPCEPCPSCSDGIQNQGEEGIDCGGPCPPCPTTTTTVTTTVITTTSTTTSTALETTTTSAKETTTTISAGEEKGIPWIWVIVTIMVIGAAIFLAVRRGRGSGGERGIEEKIKTEVLGR